MNPYYSKYYGAAIISMDLNFLQGTWVPEDYFMIVGGAKKVTEHRESRVMFLFSASNLKLTISSSDYISSLTTLLNTF